jgi:hypothetical protein
VLLERASVSADQTLAITPVRQTATLGDALTYTITLRNPASSAVSYDLSLLGLPPGWLEHLDTPVTVPAQGQATAGLVLRSTLGDPQYTDFPFTVLALANNGFRTSGQAVFATGNRYVGPDGNAPILASTLVALTNPVSVGRGDIAPVTMRAANVGNVRQSYYLGLSSAPPGISVSFLQPGFDMNAGATVDVSGSVSVAPNVAPGSYEVVAYLNSYAGNQFGNLTVNVPGPGVLLSLTPGSGGAATIYTARITNSGVASDTFDVSALGPLGPAVTLAPPVVTLAPGEAQDVSATLSGTDYLPPGTSTFDVQAISRNLPAARARGSAQVILGASKGVTLAGMPAAITAPSLPANASFGVRIANSGNVEDAYSLAIIGTTGAIDASLHDAAGNGVSTVAPIRLPGNASAQFRVDAALAAGGESGTVTLRAVSQGDAAISATAVLTFSRNGAANILVSSPDTLDFGDQALSSTSPVRTVNLLNSGAGDFVIGTVSIAGTHPGDFALTAGSNACSAGGTIAAGGGTCALHARFTPLALGTRSARIDLTNANASVTVAVPMSGNGVEGSHLGAELTANRAYVQYRRTLSYLVTARNPGTTAVAGVNIALPLPVQLDPGSASWFCINAGDPNAHCTASGSGSLADTNVIVPAEGSVSYVVSGQVDGVSNNELISATAQVSSALDPGPYTASATTYAVLFRDGFQAFGDGASALTLIAAGTLDANGIRLLHVPATPTAHFIETVVRGHNARSGGFRVERVGQTQQRWVRLVAEPADGAERTGIWIALPADGVVSLGSAARDDRLVVLLRAGDEESSVQLDGLPSDRFHLSATPGETPSGAR